MKLTQPIVQNIFRIGSVEYLEEYAINLIDIKFRHLFSRAQCNNGEVSLVRAVQTQGI